MRIINYINENPKEALYNSDKEWIAAMEKQNIVVKKENWLKSAFGKKGTAFLKDFAALYVTGLDLLTQKEANRTSNFHNYIDMVMQN